MEHRADRLAVYQQSKEASTKTFDVTKKWAETNLKRASSNKRD